MRREHGRRTRLFLYKGLKAARPLGHERRLTRSRRREMDSSGWRLAKRDNAGEATSVA
jgi:hypothetical protein